MDKKSLQKKNFFFQQIGLGLQHTTVLHMKKKIYTQQQQNYVKLTSWLKNNVVLQFYRVVLVDA